MDKQAPRWNDHHDQDMIKARINVCNSYRDAFLAQGFFRLYAEKRAYERVYNGLCVNEVLTEYDRLKALAIKYAQEVL